MIELTRKRSSIFSQLSTQMSLNYFRCSGCTLAVSFGDWFFTQVAECQQNIFGLLFLVAGQFFKRGAKGFYAEIVLAAGALDAVEEGGDVDEFVPRIQKIEIEDLLSCHMEILICELKTVNG